MSKLDDLAAWKVFATLAHTRNLSSCAGEFDVEVSTISRAITSLEKALGQTVIERNTRPIQLTEFGERALELMTPILEMHSEAVHELQASNASLSGKIRLSHAPGFVERSLMPLILEFNSFYPDITFEVVGDGKIQDVLEYRADIAVVSFDSHRESLDNRVVMLSRGRNVYVPIASKAYIEEHGFPRHPRDLKNHTVFLYDGSVRRSTQSLFNEKGDEEPVVWNRVLRISNILAIKKAVLDGVGISIDMPLFHCCNEILEGKAVPVLPGWFHPPVECFVTLLKSSWNLRRHRVFAEWYSKKLQEYFGAKEKLVEPFWMPPKETGGTQKY